MRLLARREHARAELARKLAPYVNTRQDDAEAFAADETFESGALTEPAPDSAEALTELLDLLTERGLLSDERYAEMRINARGARFGDARLAYELRKEGVAEHWVEGALATLSAHGDELTRARQVWQRKFGTKKIPEQPEQARTERAKQMRFLMTRGFSGETIRRVLSGSSDDFE